MIKYFLLGFIIGLSIYSLIDLILEIIFKLLER